MFTAKLNKLEIQKKGFISDRLNWYALVAALLINIIHWALVYYKLGRLSGNILLHYNIVYGADTVDKAKYVFLTPLAALILLVLNTGLSVYFYRKEKLAAYFLNFSGIAVQLIFLAAGLAVILIND